ncbi:MAG: hypothetical protein MI864_09980 [Pseudomonadales bacterium]|uniref:Uncharacterized protein n=1 Tax=Oleiphilus messinensis TaxID=141451 RepID=A0A1Y0IDH8_9GAMM|nr:hypothetical protein [Oleiphilus messinensis]ARU58491.1 hypothetical protein OLMES_4495 [Oleiphilus messinensis]MCG8610850.1 hypothetical protein [Pseudomonadales bacterium]
MGINKEALDARIKRLEGFVQNLKLQNALNIKNKSASYVQELLLKIKDVQQLIRVIDQKRNSAQSLYRLETAQFRGAQNRFERQRVAQSRNDKVAYLNSFTDRLNRIGLVLVQMIQTAMAANDPTDHSGKNRTQLLLEGTNELESFAKLIEDLEKVQQQLVQTGYSPVQSDLTYLPGQNQCIANVQTNHSTQMLVPAEIKRLKQVNQPTVADSLVAIVVCMRLLVMVFSKYIK